LNIQLSIPEKLLRRRARLFRSLPWITFPSRTLINLLAFSILIDLSRPAISNISAAIYILILTFTAIYTIIREARGKIARSDTRNNNTKLT